MKNICLLLLAMLLGGLSFSQVSISDDGSPADSSAMLEVKSTSKGLLLPRMTTTQQQDIKNPVAGLVVFNTDSADFYGYTGSTWRSFKNADYTIDDFECGLPFVDGRDGKSYATVDINGQCWMAENLNVGTMISGAGTNAADNSLIEKYCYSDNPAYCNTYGGLYEWPEMMQYSSDTLVQGICPAGWHVPTDYEWCVMTTFVDATVNCGVYAWNGTDIGTKLKSTSGWYSGWNGTDAVGFNGLGGGCRTDYGSYFDLSTYGYWWTSKPNGWASWNRRITAYQNDIGRFYNTKEYANSVRCIRD